MTRIQKQISLPSEYWKAIESNIDNRLVRSRGDALIGILEKVYPHLSKVIIVSQPTKSKTNTQDSEGVAHKPFSHKDIQTDNHITLCACEHPESYHSEDVCLGDGATCECKKFTEGAQV